MTTNLPVGRILMFLCLLAWLGTPPVQAADAAEDAEATEQDATTDYAVYQKQVQQFLAKVDPLRDRLEQEEPPTKEEQMFGAPDPHVLALQLMTAKAAVKRELKKFDAMDHLSWEDESSVKRSVDAAMAELKRLYEEAEEFINT